MEIMASTSNAENLEKIAISYVTTQTLELIFLKTRI